MLSLVIDRESKLPCIYKGFFCVLGNLRTVHFCYREVTSNPQIEMYADPEDIIPPRAV